METKGQKWRHQISLLEREELTIDGVMTLGSYDEKEVALETEQGVLLIKGENLNIRQLNLEQGNLIVDGLIKAIVYDDPARQKKGLLDRLLK